MYDNQRKPKKIKPSYGFYKFAFVVCRILLGIVFRIRVTGRENIPEGATLVCANHSSYIDPVLVAFALGKATNIRAVARSELFSIPVLSTVIKKLGAISVRRGASDVDFLKGVMTCLKNNDKVVIFPEGTRIAHDDTAAAKDGAIRIAERAGIPLLPLSIPRRKLIFHRINLVIGKPIHVNKTDHKRSKEEYSILSKKLMEDINNLSFTKGSQI